MKKYILLILLSTLYPLSSNATEIKPCQTNECVEYFNKYKKEAQTGYADAMSTLGEFYFHGYGTDVNMELALKNYRRGAKYGSAHAQYKAGIMYLEMEQFKDIHKGISYLKKAARNNHAVAGFLLGMVLGDGKYIEPDFEESDRWLTKAYLGQNAIVNRQIAKLHFDSKYYPDLTAAISEHRASQTAQAPSNELTNLDTNTTNKDVNWKADDGTEVITVNSMALLEVLDDQLLSFEDTNPQRFAVTTGTMIIGRTCEQVHTCSTVDLNDMKLYLNTHDAIIPEEKKF